MKLNKILMSIFIVFGILCHSAFAKCGTIEMGAFDWNSAKLHSAISKYILENGYGCKVNVTTGSTLPIMADLYQKNLDVVMEVWYDNIQDQFKLFEDQDIVKRVGINTPDSAQGFYVDASTAKKYNLKSIEDMKDPQIAVLFQDPENKSKGRMISCIPGWSCYTINLVKYYSYGLDDNYTLFDPGSSSALDAVLKDSFDKGSPVFTYYWEPSVLLGLVNLVKLEEPAFNKKTWAAMMAAVGDVKKNGINELQKLRLPVTAYADMASYIAINTIFEKTEPEVIQFLSHYSISSDDVSQLLVYYLNEAEGNAQVAAIHFLKTNKDWKSWVPADIAKKIESTL